MDKWWIDRWMDKWWIDRWMGKWWIDRWMDKWWIDLWMDWSKTPFYPMPKKRKTRELLESRRRIERKKMKSEMVRNRERSERVRWGVINGYPSFGGAAWWKWTFEKETNSIPGLLRFCRSFSLSLFLSESISSLSITFIISNNLGLIIIN